MSWFTSLRCKHCGQSAERMMLTAMLQDAGAKAGLDADLCPDRNDGGQHDFVVPAKAEATSHD